MSVPDVNNILGSNVVRSIELEVTATPETQTKAKNG